MKITAALILALSLFQPVLAKTNKPKVIEWHGSNEVPDFIGGTIPTQVKYYQVGFAQGPYRHRSDIDGLNSRARLRRPEGVTCPPPPPDWADENQTRVHYPPTCDISDEQTNNRLFDSVSSDILLAFLALNPHTTVTVPSGTWVSIGIKGFIVTLNNGEDGRGENGTAGSNYTVPIPYILRALKFHSHCQKYPRGNGRKTDGWVGWPFCVHDEGGRPFEVCGDKRQILGTQVAVYYPGTLDGTLKGADWKRDLEAWKVGKDWNV